MWSRPAPMVLPEVSLRRPCHWPLVLFYLAAIICFDATVAVAIDAPVFVRKWGSRGSGNGQFEFPFALTVDDSGHVYVADTYHSKIQKFTPTGTYLTSFFGFDRPFGVTAVEDTLYVCDSLNHRMVKMTTSGAVLTTWGESGTGPGQFAWTMNADIDSAGFVYVTDHNNHRVQKFDRNGTFVSEWGSFGSGPGQFDIPVGIIIDSKNNVYVSEQNGDRVQKFTSNGTYILQWGGAGSAPGQFLEPAGLAVDAEDRIYVGDRQNNRVQVFKSDGTFVVEWGGLGTGDGQFDYPSDVDIALNGHIFVMDGENNRVQEFEPLASTNPIVWVYNPSNGHYYAKTSAGLTWMQAEAEAIELGGHLATIRSAAEDTWIHSNFGEENYWIGFTDQTTEGSWVWISGEPVTYTNWHPGEPNCSVSA